MANRFAHIYIEEQAREYPLTKKILTNFPNAVQIGIKNYRHIFNRANQQFLIQKQNPSLILAVKPDGFIYNGSDECHDSIQSDFFYTAQALNCIYDCEYCFLRGKYQSANQLIFVNQNDFFIAAEKAILNRSNPEQPLHLALSFDSDLLAIDSKIPIARNWITWARGKSDVLAELRTKTASVTNLVKIKPARQIVLVWTVSPDLVATDFEQLAPQPDQRFTAINRVIAKGWQVRLCIDPIIKIDNWEIIYKNFIDRMFNKIEAGQIYDVHIGTFRIGKTYYKKMEKLLPASRLHHQIIQTGSSAHYKENDRREILEKIAIKLAEYVPGEKIIPW